jgi:hypothetical protein
MNAGRAMKEFLGLFSLMPRSLPAGLRSSTHAAARKRDDVIEQRAAADYAWSN